MLRRCGVGRWQDNGWNICTSLGAAEEKKEESDMHQPFPLCPVKSGTHPYFCFVLNQKEPQYYRFCDLNWGAALQECSGSGFNTKCILHIPLWENIPIQRKLHVFISKLVVKIPDFPKIHSHYLLLKIYH